MGEKVNEEMTTEEPNDELIPDKMKEMISEEMIDTTEVMEKIENVEPKDTESNTLEEKKETSFLNNFSLKNLFIPKANADAST
jgi:hypothetical protein